MIVVMRPSPTQQEVETVCRYIEGKPGLRTQVSQGVERAIIGIIGRVYPELKDELERLPGVREVIRVSKPYKLASREFHPLNTVVRVGDVEIGGDEVVVFAGPCAVESERQVMEAARFVKAMGAKVLRGGAFKPRTSPYSFRGLGVSGLRLLAKAREETGLLVVTEVMAPEDVDLVATYADILQIGARNAQNYRLLEAAGRSKKPVLLKHGLAMTYEEWLLAAEYILSQDNPNVILCQRGVRSFETYTRFTLDVASVPSIKELSHLPVIVDPSHSAGRRTLVEPLALAGVAAGADGLLVEVHPNPKEALCDGAQALTLDDFRRLMEKVRAVATALGRPMAQPSPQAVSG